MTNAVYITQTCFDKGEKIKVKNKSDKVYFWGIGILFWSGTNMPAFFPLKNQFIHTEYYIYVLQVPPAQSTDESATWGYKVWVSLVFVWFKKKFF